MRGAIHEAIVTGQKGLFGDVLTFLKTQQRAEEISLAALRKAGEGYLHGEPMKAFNERVKLIARIESLPADTVEHQFKNFHRLLCARFGYVHDEKDWKRDQLSLIEHIAKMLPEPPARPGMTFEEMKNSAAADLREVAKLLNGRADEVAAGDMDAFYAVLTEYSSKWLEMLLIRQAHRAELRGEETKVKTDE